MRFRTAVPFLLTLLTMGACTQSERADNPEPAPATATVEAGPAAVIDAGGAERLPTPNVLAPATVLPRSALPERLGGVPPAVQARAVLVFDDASGTALYESNSHDRLPPASLTKIATAVVVLEAHESLDTVIETHPDLEKEWLEDSSSMGLEPGDRFSLRELLYGMLMVSGGDAARELAIATAGTESAFVERMNGLAERLHLDDTHFADVQGLDASDQFSSAWDMALLSRYAMTFPVFREIVGTETHVAAGSRELPLYNFNPLLNYTPGVDGIKTGFTEQAGHTFVASVERDGHRVTVVMLNAQSMALDSIALIEWAFASHRWP